jgi:hypothetical protein
VPETNVLRSPPGTPTSITDYSTPAVTIRPRPALRARSEPWPAPPDAAEAGHSLFRFEGVATSPARSGLDARSHSGPLLELSARVTVTWRRRRRTGPLRTA